VVFLTTTVALLDPGPVSLPRMKLKSLTFAVSRTSTVPSSKVKVPIEALLNLKRPDVRSKEFVVRLLTQKGLGFPMKDPVPETTGEVKLTPERET